MGFFIHRIFELDVTIFELKGEKMLIAFYPSNKALKESIGKPLKYRETSVFGPEYQANGVICVAGPSGDEPRWYAMVEMENGLIKSVDGKKR
jgi:hypothetical protein